MTEWPEDNQTFEFENNSTYCSIPHHNQYRRSAVPRLQRNSVIGGYIVQGDKESMELQEPKPFIYLNVLSNDLYPPLHGGIAHSPAKEDSSLFINSSVPKRK